VNILDRSLAQLADALGRRGVSSTELVSEALHWYSLREPTQHAYKHVEPARALEAAVAADRMLADDAAPGPMCGIPISVKDLYGVTGLPTYAGTARQLPEAWSRDAWLVSTLRTQGAVVIGKTHTVELAYGAVGINPHWGTPWNPWDAEVHRIPGGSSCGAGVSLHQRSALVALGTDTGGSIRIPAALTGMVGHKTTGGRWPTDGVVPLSTTFDSVGALTRTVSDSVWFFGSVDPSWGDPRALLAQLEASSDRPVRVGVPRTDIWKACQTDIADVIHRALDDLEGSGWTLVEIDGARLDEAGRLYARGGIAGAECKAFLERDLPGWLEILHPTVGRRLQSAVELGGAAYTEAMAERGRLVETAPVLFEEVDVLALPGALLTPPPVSELEDLDRYLEVNATLLRPTSPASVLGLCALSLPVGRDRAGMPVSLQLVAPGGADEALLGAGLAAERILGPPAVRLGVPPEG
jgi:aspartyl-tRNA(Asn)/glutamyl-tRNA(Gln) amidotransferase subunit A